MNWAMLPQGNRCKQGWRRSCSLTTTEPLWQSKINEWRAIIGLNKNYFWEQDGFYIRIQALVVGKTHRRLGIAQKLVEAVEKLAKEMGASAILLNCGNREEREAAHRFYPKIGFEAKSTGYIKKIG